MQGLGALGQGFFQGIQAANQSNVADATIEYRKQQAAAEALYRQQQAEANRIQQEQLNLYRQGTQDQRQQAADLARQKFEQEQSQRANDAKYETYLRGGTANVPPDQLRHVVPSLERAYTGDADSAGYWQRNDFYKRFGGLPSYTEERANKKYGAAVKLLGLVQDGTVSIETVVPHLNLNGVDIGAIKLAYPHLAGTLAGVEAYMSKANTDKAGVDMSIMQSKPGVPYTPGPQIPAQGAPAPIDSQSANEGPAPTPRLPLPGYMGQTSQVTPMTNGDIIAAQKGKEAANVAQGTEAGKNLDPNYAAMQQARIDRMRAQTESYKRNAEIALIRLADSKDPLISEKRRAEIATMALDIKSQMRNGKNPQLQPVYDQLMQAIQAPPRAAMPSTAPTGARKVRVRDTKTGRTGTTTLEPGQALPPGVEIIQ